MHEQFEKRIGTPVFWGSAVLWGIEIEMLSILAGPLPGLSLV